MPLDLHRVSPPTFLPAVVGLVASVVTVALDVRADPEGVGAEVLSTSPGWAGAANGMLLIVGATLVLVRGGNRVVARVMTGFGLFWVTVGLAESFMRFGVRADDALPGTELAYWIVERAGAFLLIGIPALLLVYPDGRMLPGRWGWVGRVSLGVMVLTAGTFLIGPAPTLRGEERLPADFDVDLTTIAWAPLDAVIGVLVLLSTVGAVLSAGAVLLRHRRADGLERDQMRWLLWGVIVEALLVGLTVALGSERLSLAVTFFIVAVPTVAVVMGLAFPRAVQIDDLLGRTLVYGGIGVVIVVVDLLALAGVTALFDDTLDQRQVVVVVLLLSALVYSPLREYGWRTVRRVLFGRRGDPYGVVAELATSLETLDDGPEQLATVASSVADAFGVRYVSVEVDRGRGDHVVAAFGERPAEVRTLPITYRGETVGRLVLPARGVRAGLSRRDERLLGDLVRQAATAARTGRLADELQDSRERLVLAREEERRRIRRDLHDGLGPSLSGVVFRLESARLQVTSDPEAAIESLGTTRSLVQDVVADVRRLVHDLRPPALDDLGLVGALRQLAESTGQGRVAVEADDLPELPAAVEVAAYRIAAEAMTNVARHSGAEHAEVSLTVVDGELLLRVSDDGRGIPADARSGVGLVSLRERADELGGRSDVTCPPSGGTVVRAWLPLRSAS